MYKQKLSLSLNGDFGISFEEQVRLFKRTGFEAFTGHWRYGEDESIISCAKAVVPRMSITRILDFEKSTPQR